jgi:hypothetical protein
MKLLPSTKIAAVILAALLALPATRAYEAPLEAESIRDAYFLGQRGDQKLVEFFKSYTHHLPVPKTGAYISEIELLTPYAQVVERSRENTVGYSAQQAKEDYEGRGDWIRVRVRIEFTPTYSGADSHVGARRVPPQAPDLDFWKEFKFRLRQGGGLIVPSNVHGEAIYSDDAQIGAYVWLKYAAKDVASKETTVRVVAPDGQRVTTVFDLEKLR